MEGCDRNISVQIFGDTGKVEKIRTSKNARKEIGPGDTDLRNAEHCAKPIYWLVGSLRLPWWHGAIRWANVSERRNENRFARTLHLRRLQPLPARRSLAHPVEG